MLFFQHCGLFWKILMWTTPVWIKDVHCPEYVWIQTWLLYIINNSVHHLGDFLWCLVDRAVFFPDPKFFFLFFSGTIWWLWTSASPLPIVACSEEFICSSVVISETTSGTSVFLWTTLVWGWSNLFEMLCSSLAWDDWMGQGRTSQSKCMWAGTWARAWVWDTEEPEATTVRKGGLLGDGSNSLWDSLASGWGVMSFRWTSCCENCGGCERCCCYRVCKKKIYAWSESAPHT